MRTLKVKVQEILDGNKIEQEFFGNDRAFWLVGSGKNRVAIITYKDSDGKWFIRNCTCRVHGLFPMGLGEKKCCFSQALKIHMGIGE